MSGVKGGTGSRPQLESVWVVHDQDYINLLAWSPKGQLLACASADGGVAVYARDDGRLLWRHVVHGLGTMSLAWSPDGRWLASGGQDDHIMMWEPLTGEQSGRWKAGQGWVEKLVWSSDGVLASIAGKELKLWDQQGSLRQAFKPAASTLTGLEWMADGSLLTACYGQVERWRPGQQESVRSYYWKGSLLSMSASPDGAWIAAGSQEGVVQLWRSNVGKDLHMSGFTAKVRHLGWSPDSRFFSIGGGEEVLIWDFSSSGPEGNEPDYLPAHMGIITALAPNPINSWIVSGADDGILIIYDAAARQILAATMDEEAVSTLIWHPEGEFLTAGYADGTVKLLHLTGLQ